MNPEFIRWKSISNRINGFHTHPCNNGHAKIQTADHADCALFAGEFQLLQLARLTNSFMTYHPIDFNTDMALLSDYQSVIYPDSKTSLSSSILACGNFFGCLVKILVIICFVHAAHSLPLNQSHGPHKLHLAVWG